MRSTIAALLALLVSGCSLVLDADNEGEDVDASTGGDARTGGPDAAVDANTNTSDPDRPFVCDAATVALFRFDMPAPSVSSCGASRLLVPDVTPAASHATAFRTAASFDGVGQLAVADPVVDGTPLTIEMWLRPDVIPSAAPVTVLSISNPTGERKLLSIEITSASAVRFSVIDDNCAGVGASIAVPGLSAGTWSHVVATVSGKASVSVDGAADDTLIPSVCADLTNLTMFVGAAPTMGGPQGFFTGAIDELRISSSDRYP